MVFKALSAGEFTQVDQDVAELLRSVAKGSGSTLDRKTDTFGFEWVIVRDPDLEDQVAAVHAVADEFQARGFGGQLLSARRSGRRRRRSDLLDLRLQDRNVLAVRPDGPEAGARQRTRAGAEGEARAGAPDRARPEQVARVVRRTDLGRAVRAAERRDRGAVGAVCRGVLDSCCGVGVVLVEGLVLQQGLRERVQLAAVLPAGARRPRRGPRRRCGGSPRRSAAACARRRRTILGNFLSRAGSPRAGRRPSSCPSVRPSGGRSP